MSDLAHRAYVARRCLTAVPVHALACNGNFVICFDHHFVAVRRDSEGLWVNLSHRTHQWNPMRLCSGRGVPLAWSEEQMYYELHFAELDGVFQVQVRVSLFQLYMVVDEVVFALVCRRLPNIPTHTRAMSRQPARSFRYAVSS